MTASLAYSYSACLSEKEQAEIDQQVKENRCRGFEKGITISISVYSIYALARATSAYAADSCPDPGKIPENNGAVQPAPQPKPGHKPLGEGPKGAFVGGASALTKWRLLFRCSLCFSVSYRGDSY